MKAKIVIIPMDNKIYEKNISMASALSEVYNYADMNNVPGEIDSFVNSGFIVVITSGSYHKVYLSDKCSLYQVNSLLEFIRANQKYAFAKITMVSVCDKKIVEGTLSVTDIEDFIYSNVSYEDYNNRVYKDENINSKTKINVKENKNVR